MNITSTWRRKRKLTLICRIQKILWDCPSQPTSWPPGLQSSSDLFHHVVRFLLSSQPRKQLHFQASTTYPDIRDDFYLVRQTLLSNDRGEPRGREVVNEFRWEASLPSLRMTDEKPSTCQSISNSSRIDGRQIGGGETRHENQCCLALIFFIVLSKI